MFRIARVRIRWINKNQHESNDVLRTQPAPTAESITVSQPLRVLGTLDLPKVRVRLSWLGVGAIKRVDAWAWGLFILVLGTFIFARLPARNLADSAFEAARANLAGLMTDEVKLNDETIKMSHPLLDMGQPQDVFDHDTETLIRGLEANPFVLDFEFPTARPITGLVMDFGGMDFDLRVQVYGSEDGQPVLYQAEYRDQPPEPHVELNFTSGPRLVSRIYIEIEQFNPPDEPHIHVREVLFKE